MAKADPCLAFLGAATGTTSVCPARTGTTWLALAPGAAPAPVPAELAAAISVSRIRAAAAGAESTTEAAKPDRPGLPATTACSLIGPVAAVKAPTPLPGTITAAVTGTLAVTSSAAAVPPSGVRGT